MKNYSISALLFLTIIFETAACPVCERAQPKILKGITHGAGPESSWDYLIITTAAVIVLVALFYSVKWIIWPGEKSADHIKKIVLNDWRYE